MHRRMASTRVSAIVVNYRRPAMTCACLAAVREALSRVDGSTEVIVVDNGSGDDSGAAIREAMPEALLLELPENRGFPTAASEAVRHSSGEWILLVNNDVIFEPDAVAELLSVGESAPDIGSVAAQMRFADDEGVINSAGIGVDRLGIAFDRLLGAPVSASEDQPVEVFGACGGAALHRRRTLDEGGGVGEKVFFALQGADPAGEGGEGGGGWMDAARASVPPRHR